MKQIVANGGVRVSFARGTKRAKVALFWETLSVELLRADAIHAVAIGKVTTSYVVTGKRDTIATKRDVPLPMDISLDSLIPYIVGNTDKYIVGMPMKNYSRVESAVLIPQTSRAWETLRHMADRFDAHIDYGVGADTRRVQDRKMLPKAKI